MELKSESIHSIEIVWKQTNWDLNDFHTGFLVLVQLKITYLLYNHINESCYMHFEGLLYGSRRKSLSWRLNAIIIFDDYLSAMLLMRHKISCWMNLQFKLQSCTVLTMCSQQNNKCQSEQQTNHFWGSYLVLKLNSSCYTEHVQPRQIYAKYGH